MSGRPSPRYRSAASNTSSVSSGKYTGGGVYIRWEHEDERDEGRKTKRGLGDRKRCSVVLYHKGQGYPSSFITVYVIKGVSPYQWEDHSSVLSYTLFTTLLTTVEYLYKWKNHFYEMKGDVGMSSHEKERNKKMPTPRHKVTHNPIPTSLFCFNMLFVCLL